MAVFQYFACTARAALSPSALAMRSTAIRSLINECETHIPVLGDAAPGCWLSVLPAMLAKAGSDPRSKAVVAAAWEFLVHLVSMEVLEDVLLWRLLAEAGVRSPARSRQTPGTLLAHLAPIAPSARPGVGGAVPVPRAPALVRKDKRPTLAFPEGRMFDFFVEGLRRRDSGSRRAACGADERLVADYNVKALLYFLTLAFACVRGSEPLHWFLQDVGYDFESDSGALLSIWDPISGPAPSRADGSSRDRETYLREEFGLRPRNLASGNRRVGWKNLLLNETVAGVGQRTRAYWLLPEIGRLFWRLHEPYVRLVRPLSRIHPFYFSSTSNRSVGTPWTLDSADEAFDRGLLAIGLERDAAKGLCLHAWRHRGKRWMDGAGISPANQQVVLHQQSIESQNDYGKLGPIEVAGILRAATSGSGGAGRAVPPPATAVATTECATIGRAIADYFKEHYDDLV